MKYYGNQRHIVCLPSGLLLGIIFIIFSGPHIYAQCNLNVNAGNDTTICSGFSLNLSARATGGNGLPISYSWSPASGLSATNVPNPIALPAVTTTYTVTATQGACSASDQIVITVNPLPAIDFNFTNNLCSGSTFQFTPSITGPGTFSYAWTFGDGGTSNAESPAHVYNADYGNGTQVFQAKLTVTNTLTGCPSQMTKPVTVKQAPDPIMGSIQAQLIDFQGQPTFRACSSSAVDITFTNTSSTNATNTSYVINWGDGTAQFSGSSWTTLAHTYPLGTKDLTYTIQGQNGCSVTRTYKVFVGSNPGLGFGYGGNADNCSPSPLTFLISATENNPPGTTYTVTFNDGSPALVFNHPPPASFSHSFLISSCGTTSSSGRGPIPNSFSANMVASNPCGESSIGLVPIYVSTPPVAEFGYDNLVEPVACTNNDVVVRNNSTGSVEVVNGSCNTSAKVVWQITPSAGVTLTNGSLGNDFGSDNASAWLTGTNLILPRFSIPGTYIITMKVGNKCGTDTAVDTICIESPLTPQFTLNANSGCAPLAVNVTNTTNTANTCNAPTYLWEVTYTSNNCGNSSSWAFTGGTTSSTVNPSLLFSNPGTYHLRLSATGRCGTTSTTQTIEVKQPPVVSLLSIASVCQTFPATIINPAANISLCGGNSSTYSWSFPGGNPSSSTNADPGAVSYSGPGTYTISLTVTNECGSTSVTSNTFTIYPTPVLGDIASQEKCRGQLTDAVTFSSSLTGTSFNWINNNSSIGLPSSGSGNINPFTLLNTTTSVQTATITVTPVINATGCTGASKSFTLNVHPQATVNAVSNIVVCNNNTVNDINFNGPVSGTTYSWTNSDESIGLAASGTGNITGFTATNSTTSPVTATITVTPYNAFGCPGTSRTFTIRVNPTPQVLNLSNKEFCNGVVSPSIVFNSDVSGSTYSWTNSNTSIGLPASGTGNIPSFTPVNSGAVQVTALITVTVSANGCSGSDQTFTITVYPLSAITFTPGDQTICSGDNSAAVTLNSATPGVTYRWRAEVPAGITGATLSGLTGTIPVQTLANSTNTPLTVLYKATATLTGGVTCEGAEFVYRITVNPRPSVTDMSGTACSASAFTITPSNGNGNIIPAGTKYTWGTPVITPEGAITGGGAQAVPSTSISQTLTNSTNAEATATYSVTPEANGCSGQPFNVMIIVNPRATVNTVNNVVVCNGARTTEVIFSGDVPASVFNWVNNTPSIGLSASGSGQIPVFTAINNGSSPVTATITVTPAYNNCNGDSRTFTITVNPTPGVNEIADLNLCNNQTAGPVPLTGNVAGTAFTWTNDNVSIGLGASGNGNLPVFTATNAGSSPVTATLTVTPTANGCTGVARTFSIRVNPTPTVDRMQDQDKCEGQQSDPVIFNGNVPGTVYNWVNSNPAIGLAASGTGNISSFLLENTGIGNLTSSITVTPVINGCPGTEKVFTITVRPKPAVNSVSSITVCNNAMVNEISFSSTVANTLFSWSNDKPGIGIAASGSGNIPAFSAVNTGNTPVIATITITPSNDLGCSGPVKTFTIIVNPIPGLMSLDNQEYCNGVSAGPINFSNSVAGTNYSWTISDPSIGLPAAGTGNIPSFIPVNSGTEPITATVMVTPTADGCTGVPQYFNIKVNPSASVIFSSDNQIICSGENSSPVLLSSQTTGANFSWYAVIPNGISGAALNGTSTIPIQSLINSTDAPLTIIYKTTARVPGGFLCEGAEYNYTITVNPKPHVQENISRIICSGSGFSVSPASGGGNIIPSGTKYIWSLPVVSPAGALSGGTAQESPQSSIGQVLTNLTNEIATATYSVTPISDSCVGEPFNVTVTVKPIPIVNLKPDIEICNGAAHPSILFDGNIPETLYTWTNSDPSGGVAASGTGNIPAFTASLTGSLPKIMRILVTPSYNGCTGITDTFNITVYPVLPVAVSITASSNNICPGTSVTYTALPQNGGANPVYQWTINGNNSGTNSPALTYSPLDGDIVQCKLLSDYLCPSGNPALSNSIKMVVYSALPAGITVSPNLNDVCPGETVIFTATPFNEGSSPNYQWFVNGVKVGTNQPVFSYEPLNGDLVKCQLISSNVCSVSGIVMSEQLTMIVAPPGLQPSFTFDQTDECTPVMIKFKNTSPSGGVAYIWDFGDGTGISTATPAEVSHTFQNFGSDPVLFNVSLKVVTRFTHCFNTVTRQVLVKPELFAGTPVNYSGCSPFTRKFENAYPGAKSYKWITDKNILLSTDFQPTFTFISAGRRDSVHTVYLVAESFSGCLDTIVNTIKVSPALDMPSFTYSGNTNCKSVTYTFTNTSPEGAEVFVWEFDDGTINKTYHANETVTHTFFNAMDEPIPFNVKLTSMNGTYCSLSVTKQIMVNPDYTAGYPVAFQGCSPVTRTFLNAFDGSRTYQWKSFDGKVLSNTQSPTLTFTTGLNRDSTYIIYLITESVDGCRDTVTNKVIVRAANNTSFSATPLEGCAPLLVQFNNTSSPGIESFEWQFGDQSDYSVFENPRHVYIDAQGLEQTFKARFVGFNQYGCSDTIYRDIHLLATPQVDFTALPYQQNYPDRTVQLTNYTPPGNWVYIWNFGDQKPSLTGNVSNYIYSGPGEYVISLNAKGQYCENTSREKVIINPGVPMASFVPDTSGCAPLKVRFRNVSQNTVRYHWDFGNGTQSENYAPTVTYHEQGTFVVRLQAFNEFGVMSESERTIVVYPVPKAVFKSVPDRVRIPGQAVTFFNYSENGKDYLWDFGDGSTSVDNEPVYEYKQTGLFDVKLYVTSAEGCKDTTLIQKAVDVFSDGLEVPNAFIPDKSGPNGGTYVPGDPANHVFYPAVATGDVEEYELMIYNRWGNLLFVTNEVEKGWDGYYNGRLCPQDVYIWKIRCRFKSGNTVIKTGDVTLLR